jgi:hypothetical protein
MGESKCCWTRRKINDESQENRGANRELDEEEDALLTRLSDATNGFGNGDTYLSEKRASMLVNFEVHATNPSQM